MKFRHKRGVSLSRLSLSVAGAALLGMVMFFSLRAAWGMYDKLLVASDQEQLARTQLAALESQETRVSTATAALSTERGIEAEIRSRYGVARPNEGEIKIVTTAASSAIPTGQGQGFWQRLWHAVFVW